MRQAPTLADEQPNVRGRLCVGTPRLICPQRGSLVYISCNPRMYLWGFCGLVVATAYPTNLAASPSPPSQSWACMTEGLTTTQVG